MARSQRCAALVGPYLSGKTSLLESILHVTGQTDRRGSVTEGNTVGDASPESRDRQMSTEMNIAHTTYLDDPWALIDCPGSVEFLQEARHGLMVCDVAVVVCEPDIDKAMMLAPTFKFLDEHDIPHIVFINKIDQLGQTSVADLLAAMQQASDRPLILRHIPIRDGEEIKGYVDLASERAYEYNPGEASALVEIPADVADEEEDARNQMLEALSDFDDTLLEALLEEAVPPKEEVYKYLTETLRSDQVVPVLIGSANNDAGVRRLMKLLRHETPDQQAAAMRCEVEPANGLRATVFKTLHMPHTGKLSVARIWSGSVKDGTTVTGTGGISERISGMSRLQGHTQDKESSASAGDVIALGRMDDVTTGMVLTDGEDVAGVWPAPALPLFSRAISAEKRDDETKLSTSLAHVIEEDPSLRADHNQDTNELVLFGQGDIHIRVALDRLKNRYNVGVVGRQPQVAYKETIRKPVSQHARHKKQSGGHGQFGDVQIDIKPLPRGSGFEFAETIHGGSVPKQYIPAVEKGVREYLQSGPLGFPVVDVAVTLTDGKYHAVDSSDQAFSTAGSLAMREGMPKCSPVLLEPIYDVKISAPADFTSNIQALISGRRGQILGFDAKDGWSGWDEISAKLPESEVQDLIIELRSLTKGVGSFEQSFDHLQELTGRAADEVVQARNGADA